jgi:hypothetical protein
MAITQSRSMQWKRKILSFFLHGFQSFVEYFPLHLGFIMREERGVVASFAVNE